MQNEPHLLILPWSVTLGALEEAFLHAHVHARATAPPGATADPTVCPVSGTGSPDTADPHDEPLLDGAQLLRAAREPIEWLLTLAHRLAAGEPEETAAIDRMRAAFHARLAGRAIGVRMRDVLVVFGLLLGALDPRVVHDGVARTVADGVAMLLTYEGVSLAAQLARIADSMPTTVHQRASRRRNSTPRPTTL